MGIDARVTIGVGFALENDVWDAWKKKVDPAGNYADEEVFWENIPEHITDVLECGDAGSYWTGKVSHYVSVTRLTKSEDIYDMPDGIFGFERPILKLDERVAINELTALIGQKPAEPHQFVAILYS